ncbi:MAG: ElyC/SanA/YdcF family protein [Bacteroidales bacterium]|nr:ElyC/SanA/YdcF family protein [Bacteroidales bacterium]
MKNILVTIGCFAVVMIILAFTPAPFWMWYGMGVKTAGINRPPGYIILLGGGGMPSESSLMRSWYVAGAAGYFPHSKVIIALPGDTSDIHSAINLLKKELILRSVAPERIMFEDSGANTRSQALNIFKRISNIEYRISNIEQKKDSSLATRHLSLVTCHSSLLLVTSPEHLFRAVLAFKKAGFLKVDGLPAFEQAIESDITFISGKLGGRKFIPDIGNNITLRYQFWTQMNYELLVIREWAALGYYKLKGWI